MLGCLSLLVASPVPLAEVPVEMVNGRLYFPVEVAGKPSAFVLDTGAGLTVMDVDLARTTGAKVRGEAQVNGVGGKSSGAVELEGYTVRLPSLHAVQPVRIALPLRTLRRFEGRDMDGILGGDFFARYVVEFDYPNKVVRLYDPATYEYKGSGSVVPLSVQGGRAFVQTRVDWNAQRENASTLIDTGADDVTITRRFAKRLGAILPTEGRFTGGVGGTTISAATQIEVMNVGATDLHAIPATVTTSDEGTTGLKSSYDLQIGATVLKRFRLIVDYTGKKAIFEAMPEVDRPFRTNRTGLGIITDDDLRTFRAASVAPGSPAQAAGVREQDVILAVSDEATAKMTLSDLRQKLRELSGDVPLRLKRGDQTLDLTLHVPTR